jgi:hypothetical protein
MIPDVSASFLFKDVSLKMLVRLVFTKTGIRLEKLKTVARGLASAGPGVVPHGRPVARMSHLVKDRFFFKMIFGFFFASNPPRHHLHHDPLFLVV